MHDSDAYFFSGERYVDAIAALGATGMVDIQKLATWICMKRKMEIFFSEEFFYLAEAQLDPNDPRNADLLYLVKVRSRKSSFIFSLHAIFCCFFCRLMLETIRLVLLSRTTFD